MRFQRARYALGVIRLVNGVLALIAPRRLLRMLRVDPEANGAAIYALRLFGIRTIYLGLELLISEGEALEHAVSMAPTIHASDTIAAIIAGLRGELPARGALTGALVSSGNTALAVLARKGTEP
jgi:hypothetical protein